MSKTVESSGLGVFSVVQIVLLILKLTNLISWSWWWVLAPSWIPLAIILVCFAIVGLCLGIVAIAKLVEKI